MFSVFDYKLRFIKFDSKHGVKLFEVDRPDFKRFRRFPLHKQEIHEPLEENVFWTNLANESGFKPWHLWFVLVHIKFLNLRNKTHLSKTATKFGINFLHN